MVLAVVINVYIEITAFKSPRVAGTLLAVSEDLPDSEREGLLQDFLSINFRLWHIHAAIDDLNRFGLPFMNIGQENIGMPSIAAGGDATTTAPQHEQAPVLLKQAPKVQEARAPSCLSVRPDQCSATPI